MTERVLAITYHTLDNDNIKLWMNTAEKCGFQYKVLGMGQKWLGWSNRTYAYLEYLKQIKNDVDIVILLDGNDIFFVGDVDEFLQKFKAMNASIVIGAESACCTQRFNTPELHKLAINFSNKLAVPNIPYKYINAGTICGYVQDVINLLEIVKDDEDDQAGYMQQLISDPKSFKLDYHQSLFGEHGHGSRFYDDDKNWIYDEKTKRIINLITGEKPVIMHYPGSGETRFSEYDKFTKKIKGIKDDTDDDNITSNTLQEIIKSKNNSSTSLSNTNNSSLIEELTKNLNNTSTSLTEKFKLSKNPLKELSSKFNTATPSNKKHLIITVALITIAFFIVFIIICLLYQLIFPEKTANSSLADSSFIENPYDSYNPSSSPY